MDDATPSPALAIERNPVEAGLAAQPWQYRWSSAGAYALGSVDELLAANPWYEALGATPSDRQQRWQAYLLGEDAREEAIRRGEGVLGDEAFRQRVWQVHGRPSPRGRGRPRKLVAPAQISSQPEVTTWVT